MHRTTRIALFVALLASLILAACAPAAPASPQTIEVTKVVKETSVVEKTVVSVVTATPETQPTELPAGSVQINGAGATFPLPIYTEWVYAYQYVDPSVIINYQGIGSGGGKKGIIDGTIDFAGSDSILKAEEYTNGKDLQMVPAIAGAIVPIYNIKFEKYDAAKDPALKALILDRQTLADIYFAKIKTWNDPAILALNPDLKDKLPAQPITVVHRSDGSGTTEIFTNSLAAFSTDWAGKAGSAVEWPVDKAGNGIGGKGNQGVAGAVQNTPNSIGYVELNYAIANKIPFTQMVNKAGKTDPDAVRAAMLSIKGYKGAEGEYNFDANGDGLHGYNVVKNVGGKIEFAKHIEFPA